MLRCLFSQKPYPFGPVRTTPPQDWTHKKRTSSFFVLILALLLRAPLPLFRVLGSPRWNRGMGHDEPTVQFAVIPAFWQGHGQVKRGYCDRDKQSTVRNTKDTRETDMENQRECANNRHKISSEGRGTCGDGAQRNAQNSMLSRYSVQSLKKEALY